MRFLFLIILSTMLYACQTEAESSPMKIRIFQSTAKGDLFKEVSTIEKNEKNKLSIQVDSSRKFQKIIGFGGAFTESSAHLFNLLGKENQEMILEAYFGDEGAAYSICRTHINSCDFSLDYYDYNKGIEDTLLTNFSIEEDMDDIVPFILAAQKTSTDGFKLLASPWTAPPWMKDNKKWEGGRLLKEHYPSWARYFVKYLEAYEAVGIPFWGVTVENEPLGNNENWESMHFSPEEMIAFVKDHLGPALKDSFPEIKTFMYDQNRGNELEEWAEKIYADEELQQYIHGMAIHWYSSTFDPMTASIDNIYELAPDQMIIQSEACIDNDIPVWKEDQWYWSKEATDWGYDWASDEEKHLHPKYVPVYRYATDIISTLNHHTNAWIDWNMILNKQGGPNHAENWCIAPVIVDEIADEVYFTPLYYTLKHFSKYIRPNSRILDIQLSDKNIEGLAAMNQDGSSIVVLLNQTKEEKTVELSFSGEDLDRSYFILPPEAIQTIVVEK